MADDRPELAHLPGHLRAACRLVPGAPVLWEHLAWPALAARRDAGDTLAVLPVAATEQHGPHLPTGCDTIIGEAVCAYASALTGVVVLPTLAIGCSVGHTPRWPGTVSLGHQNLSDAVGSIAAWLLATGFDRLILVSSHMGNDAPLRVAVDRLRTTHLGALLVGLHATFTLTPEIWRTFREDAADLHANKAETDLLLLLCPHLVDRDAMAKADDPDRTVGSAFSHPVGVTSTNGVTGSPSLANAADGEALLRRCGEALAAVLERAKAEAAPLGVDAEAQRCQPPSAERWRSQTP
ncbi:creatininase family protein [Phycisphaera mikurensis]|uniref:Putative creatininase n=1 Tax=Phycisphaera mikurensis (strain NBRC 102666 / KCTC 22515 / FYK2301M01) TaxID=1142394 RepID=I0IDZ6_PHYMF|nr:creatininase family protein [Phycisphaera mikurensis]MBB6441291.1 creatinine amidohydrolase [Phycisphaera mikurensis]BAM03484.1 putative creatininase [Phycisphaera mikurensis NBRC 102666]